MLLRFRAHNTTSIWGEQELSLVASKLDDRPDGLIDAGDTVSDKVLPFVVIYGANASGKSNIINSLIYMRKLVLFSHSRGDPDGGVARKVFAFDDRSNDAATGCNADFIVNGVRYHYGFEANSRQFLKEWLFSFPNGRKQELFQRERQKFEFGRGLRGQNKVISDLTRTNSLFISAAAQNDHQQLTPIRNFFRSIRRVSALDVRAAEAARRLKGEKLDSRIVEFLKNIGTGVVSAKRTPAELPAELKELQGQFLKILENWSKQQKVKATLNEESPTQIQLGHKNASGKDIFLPLEDESDGTRRLLIVLHEVFEALDRGTILLLDEMNASLHTKVCELLLYAFSTQSINKNGAQLIATTHDTNVLGSEIVRRDQIWFTEKDEIGATCLFPLTDISTRKGDNLEKGYLQGRYGAIPCSNMEFLTKLGSP